MRHRKILLKKKRPTATATIMLPGSRIDAHAKFAARREPDWRATFGNVSLPDRVDRWS